MSASLSPEHRGRVGRLPQSLVGGVAEHAVAGPARGAAPLVIHGVQHTMHPPIHLTGRDDGRPSFLVFITRDLDRNSVDRSLRGFLSMAKPSG